MIYDETLSTVALDQPIHGYEFSEIHPPSPKPVTYSRASTQGLWIKHISLDQCDRSSLASLLVHLSQLQNLSPYRIRSDDPTKLLSCPSLPNQTRLDVSLPIDISVENSCLSLAYELSHYGSAHTLLSRSELGLPEEVVSAIISRALVCLRNLHDNRILHRALCARHLLVVPSSNAYTQKIELAVILCGLGSLTQVTPRGSIVARNDLPFLLMSWRGWHYQEDSATITASKPLTSHPVAWYSPEMLAQDFTGYAKPTDVYSLGLTIAELFTGRTPYFGSPPSLIFLKKMTQVDVPNLERPPSLPPASEEMKQVFMAATKHSPAERATVAQLLQMEWIKAGLERPFTVDLIEPWLSM